MRTSSIPPGRTSRWIAAALCGALGIASCALMNADAEEVYAFSHRLHVEGQGIDCSVCHKTDGDAPLPTMPGPGLCLLCHKEGDAAKPQERRIHVLFDDDVFRATHASRLGEEIVFDHRAHLARDQDCASCHTGIASNERLTTADAITMEDCVACHSRYRPEEACSVCHERIDQRWEPESHQREWTAMHGPLVRSGTTLEAGRCELCHTEATCVQCHQEQKPQNHDNFWRIRGHGVAASIDRQNCWTCHRDDYCQRCHMEVQPISHTGTFGSPRNTHCLGCHFPLNNQGCITCHQSTPSHFTAPPKPPDHNPAMNCRLCHGQGAPLMHVDDGTDCNLCHM